MISAPEETWTCHWCRLDTTKKNLKKNPFYMVLDSCGCVLFWICHRCVCYWKRTGAPPGWRESGLADAPRTRSVTKHALSTRSVDSIFLW